MHFATTRREGTIGIEGSPIEYYLLVGGRYVCVYAYNPDCNKWYPNCISRTHVFDLNRTDFYS